jgi:chemotaxis-related protein WspB
MLLLLFELAGQRYGLDTRRVLEVATLPLLRTIPGTPPAVLGTFTYRGTLTPVVDLSIAVGGPPCRALFSTRLVLADYPGPDARPRALGLVAERVTETLAVTDTDLQPPGVVSTAAPFLGAMARTSDGGLIQTIVPETLLSAELRAILFPEPAVSRSHA